MHVDILIFAAIAAFLVYKLNSLLGTRHGDERARPTPFADKPAKSATIHTLDVPARPVAPPASLPDGMISGDSDGRILEGLAEIAQADAGFDVRSFMEGAHYAFPMVVESYAKGDIEALESLLSPKLFKDFEKGIKDRTEKGHTAEVTIHRIKAARITEAKLAGLMAYITIDYDVEETAITRDAEGKLITGDPDHIFSVEDIWTFTRDIRSSDPNWILTETRTVEK